MLSYPSLKKWSIRSLRYSLDLLKKQNLACYPDKHISGILISQDMLLAEIQKRSK